MKPASLPGRIVGAIRRHPFWTIAAVPLALAAYVVALIPFTPSIGDIKKAKQEQPSVVLSADGKELAVFRRANRDWVKLSDISPKVTAALLATEDKRFYQHPGIDVVRTAKAAINTFRGDREGGSTITQQLARNLYPEQIGRAPTLTRKIKEAITALKIEAVYSKDEILETYLNSVSFLYNAWGIEMAARTYFDKPAKDLNELEAATLVGMLKGTAYYNPVLNPDRALERRNTVLALMVKDGKLSESRFEQLKGKPLKLDFSRMPDNEGPAPHLAEYLRRWLIDWADQHDYNIYADGLVVKTTIDSRLQKMANEAVARQMKQLQAVADVEWSRSSNPGRGSDPAAYVAARAKANPFEYFWNTHPELVTEWIRESPEYKAARDDGRSESEALKQLRADHDFMAQLRRQKTTLETGFVAIEPGTGAVKAWVGSRDWDLDKYDHVQQARRQPGSTFKPFVYGAAFEQGMQPWDTIMDTPTDIQIDRNKTWRPTDIEDPTNQPMTLRDALAHSRNTVTAQLIMRVGPSRVASVARALGVRESKLDEVPSLALGTSPVTLKEMVTAFSSIANGGSYVEPRIVTAVEDRGHNVLESFAPSTPQSGLEHEAANTLLDVMRSVVDYGTAAGLRPRFGLSGDLAGKTGTTQDNKDGWFIAMHPQLVAGAWVGFNDNRVAMRSSYWGQGAHNALLLVGDFLQHSEKAGVIDAKATFAAPHLKAPEPTLQQKMGDWWASVFNTAPSTDNDTAAVAGPDVQVEQPQLEPAPESITIPPPTPLPYPAPAPAVTPDAPVIASEPQRVPAFPRPLESARPADTIPGTHVYEAPDTASAGPGTGGPADDRGGRTRSARSPGASEYTPVPLATEMGAAAAARSDAGARAGSTPARSGASAPGRSARSRGGDGAVAAQDDPYRAGRSGSVPGDRSDGGTRRSGAAAGSRGDTRSGSRSDSYGSDRGDSYGSSDTSRGRSGDTYRDSRSDTDRSGSYRGTDSYRSDTDRGDSYDSGAARRGDSYDGGAARRRDSYDSGAARRGDSYDTGRDDVTATRSARKRPRDRVDSDLSPDAAVIVRPVPATPRYRDAPPATARSGGSSVVEIAPAYQGGGSGPYEDDDE